MESMTAFWDDMGLLPGQPKAKAERFETNWTVVVVLICRTVI